MEKTTPQAAFTDARGTITDIIEDPEFAVTIVQTKKGAIRGNHYHAETEQWACVMSGLLKVSTGTQHVIAKPGELVINPAGEPHAWQALEDTVCVVFAWGPRAGRNYETDTYRLEEPILT